MKKILLSASFLVTCFFVDAQTKEFKYGITAGAFIQHYNGNLGNSFFKFKSCCFGGIPLTLGVYLNKSFDLNVGGSASHFGYNQTKEDADRIIDKERRCPGCKDRLGMGELRSLMISGNIAVRYKFANGYLLKEDAKIAPYVYAGLGINKLIDNMKLNCVNAGNHISLNAGAGFKYNITKRINVGYNLAIGCFMFDKVYVSGEVNADTDAENSKLEKRKDYYMQNTLLLGFNF